MNNSKFNVTTQDPSPFLWTRIEAAIADQKERRLEPVWGWSISIAVCVVLIFSLQISKVEPSLDNENDLSINTLYYE